MNSLESLFIISEEKKPIMFQIYKIIEDEVNRMFAETNRLISRDEIATALINNTKSRQIIQKTLKGYNKDEKDLWKKAANYVDLLNADISKNASKSLKWNNYFIRQKIYYRNPYTNHRRKIWALAPKIQKQSLLPEEIEIIDNNLFIEGAIRQININAYERNEGARLVCIDFFGCKCQVCDFDFQEKYGNIGKDYIHVHHTKALSEIKTDYEVNPYKDLIPVCPNCHAMLHRKSPPFTINELKSVINENK